MCCVTEEGRRCVAVMACSVTFLASGVALAEPAPAEATQASQVDLGTRARAAPDSGWAMGASIGGFTAAGLTLTFALAAEALNGNNAPAMTLGGLATSLVAVGGPVVYLGGASARREAPDGGYFGLRLAGWITYGTSLAEATVLLGIGAAKLTVPTGLITTTGVVGSASLICFSLDALLARNAAVRTLVEVGDDDSGVRLLPMASAVRLPDGSTHPTLGLIGQF